MTVPDRFDLDLGDGHWLRFHQWSPDRALNPHYDGIPDEPRAGALVYHLRPDGTMCTGGITFDTPVMRQLVPERAMWQIESWKPLTISPSLLCKAPVYAGDEVVGECGDHGFIRQGRWERA